MNSRADTRTSHESSSFGVVPFNRPPRSLSPFASCWPFRLLVILLLGGSVGLTRASAQTPPSPPIITEPLTDGLVVNASDVHMETAPFSDSDPGDTHLCSDWQIWTVSPPERIWFVDCITGIEKVHVHLGDGAFENSHDGRTELFYETDYRLRVRHRDNTGLWSAFSERLFETGAPTEVFPLLLKDVVGSPTPAWTDETGAPLIFPSGGLPGFLRVESPSEELLLEFRGFNGQINLIVNPSPLPDHRIVRVRLSSGSQSFLVPQSRVTFTTDQGIDETIYLPPINLLPQQIYYFWISSNGSSYVGNGSQTEPDFSTLAQGAPVPWRVAQAGYKVEVVATGFQLPVNICFVPNPGQDPGDPFYYVTELYGTIKVVKRDGTVGDYATDLLNFEPTGDFPGSGEQGLAGICVDSISGDLFAGMLYDSAPPDGPHYPKVVRFHSNDGGLTAATQTTILDMPGEEQGESHFISNFSLGPDGKLYVHMGDGFFASTALNLNSFRGKVLRLNLDGTAPSDNPFYNSGNGITATDYIFAYGFRNPFGGVWRAADGFHYEVENGPGSNDRLAKVQRGFSYGWDGTDASMLTHAIYSWNPPHAPVNIAFIEPQTFAGSGFPAEKQDHAFVTESGPGWATGPQEDGKRIVEFILGLDGSLISGPMDLIEYDGSGKASACGLAAGPDGLYFTDLYKDLGYESPIDRGANILRIQYVGTADFRADLTSGLAPHVVHFANISNVPGASTWNWDFGDGGTSTVEHPTYVYAQDGVYNVRLEVTGTNGLAVVQKNGYIVVGDQAIGLRGDYFENINLDGAAFARIDPTVSFNWGTGSPDPIIPADHFSVRWTGRVRPDFTQTYTFYTTTDDGVRLWVDGQLLIDHWVNQPPTQYSGTINLTAGQKYDLKMEYYENNGGASAKLEWKSTSQVREVIPQSHLYPPLPTSGLRADYYDEPEFTGQVVSRIDPTIDFDWDYGSPDVAINVDQFSARWTGQIEPVFSEVYTFYTTTDDGVRLWVNGQLLIDKWMNQPPTQHSGTIPLLAGQRFDIKMEYFEDSGVAIAQLEWKSPSQPREIVPASRLFPPEATSLPEPGGVSSPKGLAFEGGWSNPLRGPTEISFRVPVRGRAVLALYDVAGRESARLFDREVVPGPVFSAVLNPTHHPAGVYFLRLQVGELVERKKLILMR